MRRSADECPAPAAGPTGAGRRRGGPAARAPAAARGHRAFGPAGRSRGARSRRPASGRPRYLYDVDLIERRYAALRAALPSRVDIAYAVKANPALAIVDFLGRQGPGADVASSGELATALRAGIDPSRIVMTAPGSAMPSCRPRWRPASAR